jgi:hypothetical protein
MCKQTIAMANSKIIGSLLFLRTNRARNCTAIRTQIQTRVDGPLASIPDSQANHHFYYLLESTHTCIYEGSEGRGVCLQLRLNACMEILKKQVVDTDNKILKTTI